MKEFFHFLFAHAFLSGLFIVLFVTWLTYEIRLRLSGMHAVSITETTQLFNRDAAILVDVRSQLAFGNGHILGAKHLPADLCSKPEAVHKVLPDKQKKIILICNAGNSALTCATHLRAQGYNDVHILQGGMQAWNNANLPTETGNA